MALPGVWCAAAELPLQGVDKRTETLQRGNVVRGEGTSGAVGPLPAGLVLPLRRDYFSTGAPIIDAKTTGPEVSLITGGNSWTLFATSNHVE